MKKTIISLCLLILFLTPASGQGRHTLAAFREGQGENPDTVRALLADVYDIEHVMFSVAEGGDTLKVQLGGKAKLVSSEFCSLDVRVGDTLTVAGIRNPKKKRKQNDPEMISARILSHVFAADHDEKPVYGFSLEVKPTFLGGGTRNFSNWVTSRLVYPEESKNFGSKGTCLFRFTIDKCGEMVDIELITSSGDPLLDAEAYRVIRSAPAWTPGYIRGKPVEVTYRFPVVFELRDPKMSSSWGMQRR